ncbi:MAG: ABC transporter permease [Clostridiales bacterium]|nr:ABC transporter permease [Clostridiales bacterium]
MNKFWKDVKQYPTAIIGLILIALVVSLAIYAVITIPYNDAIVSWRGDEASTYRNPEKVPPVWTNLFRVDKLPEGFYNVISEEGAKDVEVIDNTTDGLMDITYNYSFEYIEDDFLQDLIIYMTAKYDEKQPFFELVLISPDGRERAVYNGSIEPVNRYRIYQDRALKKKLGVNPMIGLFATPETVRSDNPEVLDGTYILSIRVRGFEQDTIVTTEVVAHGQVHGIAGTDHMRRDISIALLWGTPIALMFGLIAAFGVSIITLTIAATGTWFGGWLDTLIQRITEVNMMLPFLPILIMVGTFYSRSIWLILGTVILLSVFSAAIKTYRATFLQVKQSTYIEAAQVYGASNSRIITRYMMPKIIPMLIPNLVLSIPVYVFLEASLAVLGLGDPTLPTWGKLIENAYSNGALWNGQYYWIVEPAVLLIITGFAFAMVGFALDRIFNPRLRAQ